MAEWFDHGYALLIAVNESKVEEWALPDVIKDAVALQKVLTHPQRCAYPQENVKLISGSSATRQGILDGLEWLGEKLTDDPGDNATAVIYYTGHGWKGGKTSSPEYYLIPFDVRAGSPGARALRADAFAEEISLLSPKRLLVILDCCHAGGMKVKGLSSDFLDAAIPPGILMEGEKSVSIDKGIGELETKLSQGDGRAVLSSSRDTQRSYIRQDGQMSIFTYHLIEALIGYAQPREGAQEVLVSDVISYVHRKVPQSARQDAQRDQQPDFQLSGNFPIALLLGGKGISKGQSLADPLAPLPESVPSESKREVHVGDIRDVSNSQINIAGGDIESTNIGRQIYTEGGTYMEGPIHTEGGDFVAGKKIVQGDDVQTKVPISGSTGIAIGNGAQATVNYFQSGDSEEPGRRIQPVIQVISQASPEVRDQALMLVGALQQQVLKLSLDNDEQVAELVDDLVRLVPEAADPLVKLFSDASIAGVIGPTTRFVLRRLQRK